MGNTVLLTHRTRLKYWTCQVTGTKRIEANLMERIKVEEKFHKFKYAGAVDADGHILEPADLWENYIEEKYKAKALRLRRDQQGVEYIEIGGPPSRFHPSQRLSRFPA